MSLNEKAKRRFLAFFIIFIFAKIRRSKYKQAHYSLDVLIAIKPLSIIKRIMM
jgi:hypothetical protein